jgi:hypothetical protein
MQTAALFPETEVFIRKNPISNDASDWSINKDSPSDEGLSQSQLWNAVVLHEMYSG